MGLSEDKGVSIHRRIRGPEENLLTFLNSDAQLRIVVEIGGGSVACGAKTRRFSEREALSCGKRQTFCKGRHPRLN